MITKNPEAKFVAVLLDIDDFKFVNDIYGHVYGCLLYTSDAADE